MFQDIHTAPSIANCAAASFQFTREFGQVLGDLHDATSFTSSPATICIPKDSLFDRENVGTRHDLKFLQEMFEHLPISNNLYESNQARYVRLIHIITLTEGQIRTYHRDNHSLNKGLAVSSKWLTHDLSETVFHRWYQNAIDTFFTHHPEYRANLSALRPREQFFLTFFMFHCVYSPLKELLSKPDTSYHLSLSYPIVITFGPGQGHSGHGQLYTPPLHWFTMRGPWTTSCRISCGSQVP